MSTFARMLKEVVSNQLHRHTVRKIIMLKDRKNHEACVLELKKHGITPYSQVKSINMLCCHIHGKDDAWRQLKKHPHVHSIETDVKRQMYPVEKLRYSVRANKIRWGVRRIHAHEVWKCTRGKGVKVGIIDTGISPHPDLVIAGGVNVINPNKSFRDDNGHGTLVSGVVAAIGKNGMQLGVAPRTKLYAVKALDKNGEGYVSDIIEGLEWCIRNRMNIVNMSLGFNGENTALHSMVKQVYRKGIVMAAAAGNDGPKNGDGINFLSRYSEVISVAATDKRNRIASFSSRGKGINVAAPGVDIRSTNNQGAIPVMK